MVVNVVTSCSRKGWEEYGCRFVDTFLEYWPQSTTLHFVSEDVVLPHIDYRMLIYSLFSSKGANDFMTRHVNNVRVKGGDPYDYQFDAYKFSKKVFAVELIAQTVKRGKLIWVDADCVTHAPIPLDVISNYPPKGYAIAYLARPNYTECGFIGYDLDHPEALPFIHELARVYAEDEFMREKEWHDSWVWDRVRERMNVPSYKIPHPVQSSHPLIHSELGKYMDHRKGPRKKLFASPEHPLFGSKK